jgi:MFS family permease
MGWDLYLRLSALMFLEFAVWGAWYPVLAARLLGPLKFSGKQTGWIYATIPLGSIFMPLVAGHLADQWINTELILAGAHLIGALLLFIAAWKRQFGVLFIVMMLYALCFAGTIPLVNSLMFYHLKKKGVDPTSSVYIFMWAPIAWALAGYFLSGWRWIFKTGEEGRDCLVLAAVLSVVMALVSSAMPNTPPAKTGELPILQAFSMLSNPGFLAFIIVTIVASGMMQFYFLGTPRFMQDNGIAAKNVPAAMAVAQAVQALATLFLLGFLVTRAGYKWTMVAGLAFWLLLYVVYVNPKPPRWGLVATQGFHGLAYVFFIIAGQLFADAVAPEGTGASVQALVITAQSGIGLFLGTQLAGVVMDRSTVEGRFQWRRIFPVPLGVMAVCLLALGLLFWPPASNKSQGTASPSVQVAEPNL